MTKEGRITRVTRIQRSALLSQIETLTATQNSVPSSRPRFFGVRSTSTQISLFSFRINFD